jgi:hypothetical protein
LSTGNNKQTNKQYMLEVRGQPHQNTPHRLCKRDALDQHPVTVPFVHHGPHYQKLSANKII